MENPLQKPIMDSDKVNLVFKDNDNFTKALSWPRDIITLIDEMGLKGIVSVSMDNSEKNPVMSFAGPKKVIDIFLDGLSDEDVEFTIDVTKSEEPNIVKRLK